MAVDAVRSYLRPPLEFYTGLSTNPTKNWSKDLIKRGLCIDDTQYIQVYREIEERMLDRGILGLRLNTQRNKDRLEPVVSSVVARFRDTFQGIPEGWTARCLQAIAQKCTNNRRRRVGDRTEDREASSAGYPPRHLPCLLEYQARSTVLPTRHFGALLILATREDGPRSVTTTAFDLQACTPNPSEVTIADVKYLRFSRLLCEAMDYEAHKDTIWAVGIGETEARVNDERSLKAILQVAQTRGLRSVSFTLRRGRLESRKCLYIAGSAM